MNILREKAVEFRRAGKSYREIEQLLGVPRSTLSSWFATELWSKQVRTGLVAKGRTGRVKLLTDGRTKKLAEGYEKAQREAKSQFDYLMHDPLFMAGTALYWAGGDMKTRGYIRYSTSDMAQAKLFRTYLERTCGVPVERIKAYMLVYPQTDEATARRFWSFGTGIPFGNFTKSMVLQGRNRPHPLHNGLITIVVSSTILKAKMNEWLHILSKGIDR